MIRKNISVDSFTGIGGRAKNEDFYGVARTDGGILAVLADGLGGHGKGDIASKTAVNSLMRLAEQPRLPNRDEITYLLEQANREILKQQENDFHMKTTVVCLRIEDGQAVWTHIGDSRLYHFYEGRLADYTLDHSVPQLAVMMGEIERKDIPKQDERSSLFRVLGDEILNPDIHDPITLEPGRHAFLLCSDGFWEFISDEEMEEELNDSRNAAEWLGRMRQRLQLYMTGKNNCDNHTAIAIMLEQRGRK